VCYYFAARDRDDREQKPMATRPNLLGLPGARVAEPLFGIGRFLSDHLRPLLFWKSDDGPSVAEINLRELVETDEVSPSSEEQFWAAGAKNVFQRVSLNEYVLVNWFPRTPGVAWSHHAMVFLSEFNRTPLTDDAVLGPHYTPFDKVSLVEGAGIGTIRLRPRKIDGKDSWYATALTGRECHRGIPLVIPDSVLRQSGVEWGETVNIKGQIRFMQDASLDDTASYVHHASPLIVFVDHLEGARPKAKDPILINPVVLLEEGTARYGNHVLAFVNCGISEPKRAVDWLERYAKKFDGRIVTNFDQQEPTFADAPLSYQRLVAKTYDRMIIQHNGAITAERIDRVIDIGAIHVGHNIDVSGGSANINIDSTLTNVNQTIGSTNSLDAPQKAQLEQMVAALTAELSKLKAEHAEEKAAIESALKAAVATAVKPPAERKQSMLQLSAKGLKDAADLVKDIAPTVISAADLIAKFIVGL